MRNRPFLLSAFCFLLSAFCFHPFYPDSPYAVFLQNTLILWDVVPRAMPWAGMRGPFRAANRRSRISARQGSLFTSRPGPLTDGVGSVLDWD